MNHFENIKAQVQTILSGSATASDKLKKITALLQQDAEKYTWVGFYFMNHTNKTLHLGPYTGKETEHTVIPFGKGICGQVAVSGTTYVAEDVNEESNYIACSADVRSEIVVPIYHREKLLAQLDIDSRKVNAFDDNDRKFLEELCEMISEELGEEMADGKI